MPVGGPKGGTIGAPSRRIEELAARSTIGTCFAAFDRIDGNAFRAARKQAFQGQAQTALWNHFRQCPVSPWD